MLKVKDLNVSYGAIHAIHDVSLEVNAGEIVSLNGPTAAGKTPTLHIPEGRRIFASMTVEENLEMGAFTIRDKSQILADIENVYKHFPRLRERYKQAGGTLSGGEQQMLAIGRAMMSRPKIMLMDEPSMGLSPLLVGEIFEIIQELNRSGMTILLVEQNAKMALSIADRAYVLETGHVVMNGQAKDMLEDDQVRRAYLGM